MTKDNSMGVFGFCYSRLLWSHWHATQGQLFIEFCRKVGSAQDMIHRLNHGTYQYGLQIKMWKYHLIIPAVSVCVCVLSPGWFISGVFLVHGPIPSVCDVIPFSSQAAWAEMGLKLLSPATQWLHVTASAWRKKEELPLCDGISTEESRKISVKHNTMKLKIKKELKAGCETDF